MSSTLQNQRMALDIQYDLSFSYLPPLLARQLSGKVIALLQGMALLIKKISYKDEKIKVISKVIYENGSPFYVSQHYKNIFSQLPKDFQKIAYIFQPCRDSFSLNIELTITQTYSNSNIFEIYCTEISKDLLKLQKVLELLGLVRTKSKFSYQILKNELKLQKSVIKTLSFKEQPSHEGIFNRSHREMGNTVVQVDEIKEVPLSKGEPQQMEQNKKGGYFQVLKKRHEITSLDGSKMERNLAIKKSKKISKQDQVQEKIQKQLRIVSKIIDNKYAISYYKPRGPSSIIFMDYIPFNLKEMIYNDLLSIGDIFEVSKQLIEGVSILHKSYIIHRDLKLENILVDGLNDKKSIKIIDFGESALADDKYVAQHNLGSTVPYSPIQCLMETPEGFNRAEIDLWSVSMIIHELTFHRLPFYFNRHIQTDLVNGWREQGQFDTCLNLRPKKGIHKMQQILNLLSQQGLKIKQQQRLPLKSMYSVIEGVQKFYLQLLRMKNAL